MRFGFRCRFEMIKYSLIDETGRMFDEDDFEFEEYEYLTKDLVEIDGS